MIFDPTFNNQLLNPNTQAGTRPSRELTTRVNSTVFRSYISRLKYLHTRQFSCEFSGKAGLDFFAATESEKQESRVVSQRFPDQLKGRVLQTLQFRR